MTTSQQTIIMSNEPSNPNSSIHDLVECFLEKLSNTNEETEESSQLFKAYLMHEIDNTISEYLDANEMPSLMFIDLQQEFINTVAQNLTDESNYTEKNIELDVNNEGNYDIEDVFEALEFNNINPLDSASSNHDDFSWLSSEID